jgi:hypothetical protein
MKRGGLLDLLFRKQPIEKGEDDLSRSIRTNIHDMHRKLNEVERTMDELLANRAFPKDKKK